MSLLQVAQRARAASNLLNAASTESKNAALIAIAEELEKARPEIEAANRLDKANAQKNGLNAALAARLNVEGDKFATLQEGMRDVIKVTDPVGVVSLHRELDDGKFLYTRT